MKFCVIEKDYITGKMTSIFETDDGTEAQDFADAKNSRRISNEVQYFVKEA